MRYSCIDSNPRYLLRNEARVIFVKREGREDKTVLISLNVSNELSNHSADMSYFDGDLVPQNTPESAADPFVTALTAAMDHQPQDQVRCSAFFIQIANNFRFSICQNIKLYVVFAVN